MNKKLLFSMLGVFIVILVFFWLISPLFYDTVVDEELPVNSNPTPSIPLESGVVTESSDDTSSTNDEPIDLPNSLYAGAFVDADASHETSGEVTVFNEGDTQYVRFEDFSATNGPDLRVYLATDNDATDFIDLGELKGNVGNQNYVIPEGTDLEEYDTILIWCRAFSVLFGSAELS